MTTHKLTKRLIDSFVYAGGWDVRWDDAVPGLGVRIYPSGKKSFVLRYTARGRKRTMVLGLYGVDLTLDQAREKAGKGRSQARDGIDPLDEKRKLSMGETFGDLEREYIEKHAKVHKKTWAADEARLKRNIPPSWRGRIAETITRREVSALHAKIGATKPYEANRTLDLLRVMFTFGRTSGFLPAGTENPAEGIRKYDEEKRKRFARPDELPYIAAAIDHEADIYVRGALWLYLLTGGRKRELLNRRRSDMDWNAAQCRLPDTKAGEAQYLTLSGPALAILQSLPAQEKNPFIFCGAKKCSHLVNIDKPWQRVRDRATVAYWADYPHDQPTRDLVAKMRAALAADPSSSREPTVEDVEQAAKTEGVELPAGITDLRIHDLRRSAGSWMTQAGVDLNIIKEGLRHADIATTLGYARLGQDPARQAFEDHGQRILAAAGRKGPLAVVGGAGKK